MTSTHQTSLDDFDFKQKRSKRTDKASPGDVPPSDDTQHDVDVSAEEIKFLKAFDLDYTYGPAIGVSRSERWERAEKLGMNPNPRVKQLIQQHPNDPLYTECLWKGTLVAQ